MKTLEGKLGMDFRDTKNFIREVIASMNLFKKSFEYFRGKGEMWLSQMLRRR